MSGPKRNPDKLNTIGVVVVGICGAVLVYVTIVALQAFYVNDTSELQISADYGGQDTTSRSLRTEQVNRIGEYGTNSKPAAPKAGEAAKPQTFRVPIDVAMKLVIRDKAEPSTFVPTVGRSDKSTVLPIFGRPQALPADAAPAAPKAEPEAPAAKDVPATPLVPTGTGTGAQPVGGAGALQPAGTGSTGAAKPGTPTSAPTPVAPAPAASPTPAKKGNGK